LNKHICVFQESWIRAKKFHDLVSLLSATQLHFGYDKFLALPAPINMIRYHVSSILQMSCQKSSHRCLLFGALIKH